MSDFAPVKWLDSEGKTVWVGCFWAQHFPKWEEAGKHLVIACPAATWAALTDTQQTQFRGFIRKILSGEWEVSKAKRAAVLAAIRAAGIKIDVTDDPTKQLNDWGYHAPPCPMEEPPK